MTKKTIKKVKQYVLSGEMACVLILGFIAACILTKTLWDYKRPKKTAPQPPQQKKTTEVVKVVEAREEKHCFDNVDYIRCAAEDAGLSPKDASVLIRIARAESGCAINPLAKNEESTARGSFQILIGTWEGNDCDGKRTDHKANTQCAIKLYKSRGTDPWKTSAHQKSGNGWSDPNQCMRSLK